MDFVSGVMGGFQGQSVNVDELPTHRLQSQIDQKFQDYKDVAQRNKKAVDAHRLNQYNTRSAFLMNEMKKTKSPEEKKMYETELKTEEDRWTKEYGLKERTIADKEKATALREQGKYYAPKSNDIPKTEKDLENDAAYQLKKRDVIIKERAQAGKESAELLENTIKGYEVEVSNLTQERYTLEAQKEEYGWGNKEEKAIIDADSCYLVGKNLAKFHSTATDFTELNKNTRGLRWMSDIYTSLKKHLSFEDQKIIELEINFQMLLDNTDLPEGIIHGDLFRDNVLFLNNNVSGFIDLYYACNERLVYDIAITMNDWCINEDGKINKLMYTEFIKGYESERKLTENEQDRLNKDLRLAALRFWLSRLEDSYNAKEGEITSIKDPNHFKAILLNRQAMENYVN
jgi:hypothetical protein